MHADTESPGAASAMLYIALIASLSEMATVPASNVLAAFTVVAENAENVPMPATAPSAPTRRSDRSVFRPRLMRWILSMPDLLVAFLGRRPSPAFGPGRFRAPERRS